MLVSIALTAAT